MEEVSMTTSLMATVASVIVPLLGFYVANEAIASMLIQKDFEKLQKKYGFGRCSEFEQAAEEVLKKKGYRRGPDFQRIIYDGQNCPDVVSGVIAAVPGFGIFGLGQTDADRS